MATHIAAGATATLLQNAINLCSDGDTAQMPASPSSVTWNSGEGVSITKAIILDLNGWTINRGTGTTTMISVTNSIAGANQIINGTMTQATTLAFYIDIDGSFANPKFRIYNMTFVGDPNIGGQYGINIGEAWGLITGCTLSAPANSEIIHNVAYGDPAITTGWGQDIIPATIDQVYIENCAFINNDPGLSGNPANFFGNSSVQAYYGARTVVRYCTMLMSQIDVHGGPLGGRWFEIYENTWTVVLNGNQDRYVAIRSGSGVVFNNHKVGSPNQGAGNLDFNLEASDSATYHPFLGKNEVLDPGYIWNNDSTMHVTSAYTLNTDYFLSARPGYTPLVYPYPWGGGNTTYTLKRLGAHLKLVGLA